MKVNLIIDGNYVLHRNINTLVKNRTLYGDLEDSLHIIVTRLMRKYPFSNVYFVSDSREKSWRKAIYNDYKGTRKRDEEVDWEFVYNTYIKFKEDLPVRHKRITVYESDTIEGDDWITQLVKRSNQKSISTIIAASDGDLHQLLGYRVHPRWINIQWRDINQLEKIFLPSGYKLFVDALKNEQGDIFSANNHDDFLTLISEWQRLLPVEEVESEPKLFVKLVHGDKGDNIVSAYRKMSNPTKTNPTGALRGIGETGAKNIYLAFKEYHPETIDFHGDDWINKVVPFIAENKKVDPANVRHEIMDQLRLNRQLVLLHERYFPSHVRTILENKTNF